MSAMESGERHWRVRASLPAKSAPLGAGVPQGRGRVGQSNARPLSTSERWAAFRRCNQGRDAAAPERPEHKPVPVAAHVRR